MTSPLPLSVSPLDQGHPLMSPAINKAAHRQELPLESEDDETKGVEGESQLSGQVVPCIICALFMTTSQQSFPVPFLLRNSRMHTIRQPSSTLLRLRPLATCPPQPRHTFITLTEVRAPVQLRGSFGIYKLTHSVPQSHPSQSPPTPMTTMMTTSPATSMIVTPPSSASSYIQQLPINNYSPQTISPGMNALNHQMPDLSQSSMPWGYTPNIGYTTVPFPNSNGYAYPAHPQFHMPIKVYNKKEAMGMGMGGSGSPDKDDHEEELVDMEDPDDAGCLGFTAK